MWAEEEGLDEFLDDVFVEGEEAPALESISESVVSTAVDLSSITSSAERNLWSQRHGIWRVGVAKPRRAAFEDAHADWVETSPRSVPLKTDRISTLSQESCFRLDFGCALRVVPGLAAGRAVLPGQARRLRGL